MRLNKFIAQSTAMSRRAADTAIAEGRVLVNGQTPGLGMVVLSDDAVTLDGRAITPAVKTTVMLNKPAGYVCSRAGQGSRTIYDLLPGSLHHLKPVGRLDKDSSGLILLTNDGTLAQTLTHPSHQKQKVYEVTLDKPLRLADAQQIEQGVRLDDGMSRLTLEGRQLKPGNGTSESGNRSSVFWLVRMHEGRNRQIRRTFGALGYAVTHLHRTRFGAYSINRLKPGQYEVVS
jgi:23S rRNA pseudouridine2605 synthase